MVNGKSLPFSVVSKKAKAFLKTSIEALSDQRMPEEPICTPVQMKILFYGPWRAGQKNMPDQSNLIQTIEDLFQDMGILEDDRLIESHDGTRRIPLCEDCPERKTLTRGPRKGQRKDNCGKSRACPRAHTIVYITEFDKQEIEKRRKAYEDILKEAVTGSLPEKATRLEAHDVEL